MRQQRQQGSILVALVLTVAVLMFFGVSFVASTTAEYRAAMRHTQGIQAFNVAEAGLNLARRNLQNNTVSPPSALEEVAVTLPQFDTIGQAQVWVRRISTWTLTRPGLLELRAEGQQGQARRTVSILADETLGVPIDTAFSRHQVSDAVTLGSQALIQGDIAGRSFTLGPGAIITGNRFAPLPSGFFRAPAFSLPTGLPRRSPFVANPSSSSTLPGSGHYVSINVHGTLNIEVPGTGDVIVSVGNLVLHSGGQIRRTGTGTGRVLLHVGTIELVQTSGSPHPTINMNSGGDVAQFILYYHGTPLLTFPPGSNFAGIVVTRTAPITVGQNLKFDGHIITGSNEVIISGFMMGVVYAPQALVRVERFTNVRVFAQNLQLTGLPTSGGLTTRGTDTFLGHSFAPMVSELGLWQTASTYSFHAWSGR